MKNQQGMVERFFLRSFFSSVLFFCTLFAMAQGEQDAAQKNPSKRQNAYIFASVGLGSPHGMGGIGVAIPSGERLEWELSAGLPLSHDLRISAGVNIGLNSDKSSLFGISLARSISPSGHLLLNESDYDFYDSNGNMLIENNSTLFTYNRMYDLNGVEHNYWRTADGYTEVFYDFKPVTTLHLRYSLDLDGIRGTIGYGFNLSKPYEYAGGDLSLEPDLIKAFTPGGLEISLAIRLYQFGKKDKSPK